MWRDIIPIAKQHSRIVCHYSYLCYTTRPGSYQTIPNYDLLIFVLLMITNWPLCYFDDLISHRYRLLPPTLLHYFAHMQASTCAHTYIHNSSDRAFHRTFYFATTFQDLVNRVFIYPLSIMHFSGFWDFIRERIIAHFHIQK